MEENEKYRLMEERREVEIETQCPVNNSKYINRGGP